MGGSVCQLQESVFHLDLILHHGLLYVIEVLAVGGSKVNRSIAKERRSLGKGVNQVAEVTKVLNDLRQSRCLASAGASGQGDTSNILIHSYIMGHVCRHKDTTTPPSPPQPSPFVPPECAPPPATQASSPPPPNHHPYHSSTCPIPFIKPPCRPLSNSQAHRSPTFLVIHSKASIITTRTPRA